jgi:outer membrane protein assembly factor BamD
MGDRFENQQAADLSKIVKDYPLSPHADDAKAKLQAMNRPVPAADPAAYAHMQYELENQEKAGLPGRVLGVFKQKPDVRMAAKSGTPSLDPRRPSTPISIPQTIPGGGGETGVTATVVQDTSAIDKNPDARANPTGQNAVTPAAATPAAATGATASTDSSAAQQQLPPPTNHPVIKKKKPKKNQPATTTPTTTTPAAATTPATTAPANPAAPATPQQ